MTKGIDIAKSIVEKSGNSFHTKVLMYIQNAGWTVLISPYYSDNATGKPREIDLVAEKAFPFTGEFSGVKGTIHVRLVIECKFIKNEQVFWFHTQDLHATEKFIVSNTPLTARNEKTKEHRYFNNDQNLVAKMFGSSSAGDTESEPMFRAVNQTLNGLISFRQRGSIIPESSFGTFNPLWTVNYPLIVCNSFEKIYRVDVATDDDPRIINNNFQLEVNFAYTNIVNAQISEFMMIDVVSFSQLPNFLSTIDNEVQLFRFFMDFD